MSHDATKLVLGATQSSEKDISVFNSDPATYLAGLAVSQSSVAGALSLLATAGMRCGISLGKSLSDSKKTAVARTGLRVPLLGHLKRSSGVITISSYANLVSGTDDSITVGATVFTAQVGAATLGQATFQAATSNAATAISLAAQINAHATASTLVYAVVTSSGVVTLYSKVEGAGTGNDVALAYTDNDTNVGAVLSGLTAGKLSGGSDTISDIAYIVKGAKAYINRTTGKADVAMTGFSTISDATYVSGPLTGIAEDASEVAACLVDMPGGL
jgi:hypothetical protein